MPLGVPVRRFLKAHRASLPRRVRASSCPVFPLAGRQGYEAVRSVWHLVWQATDLPSMLRIHDLRHSFASHAVMLGETLFSTSRLLGHSRIQMTTRYAHLADAALSAAADKIGALMMVQAGVA